MSKKKIISLILILTLSTIAISGCISSEDDTYYQESFSFDEENHNDATFNNESNNSTKTNNPNYEVKSYCSYVVDGDTLDADGVGRIRLVGVDTPERGEPGYKEAKDFVKKNCLGKTIYLDIDDAKKEDKYGRILAIVYVDGKNINKELLEQNYAEIMYIPPSEFPRGLDGT